MSAERDVTRIVRSWLREDEHDAADRVLEVVLGRLDMTPQRRSWWPARRASPMTNALRIAIAATVVVMVGFVGVRFLSPGIGGAGASPTPTATPANLAAMPGDGATLAAGSYTVNQVPPLTITFTVPAGWYKGTLQWAVFLPGGDRDMSVAFGAVDNLYTDPCQPALGLRQPTVGPSVTDLVTALGTIPGVTATAAVNVSVDGLAAKRLDLTRTAALPACDPEPSIWRMRGGAGGPPIPDPGGTVRVWIVDAGGTRLVVAASWQSTSTAEQLAQIESVVGSIRIASPGTP